MGREKIFINDVGPRDGLQNQKILVSLDDRAALIAHLAQAKLWGIEVGAFVSPKAVPAMAGTDKLFSNLARQSQGEPVYSALIPNQRGFDNAIAAGAKTVSLVVAVSDTMNQKNINMSTQQALDVCASVIANNRNSNVDIQVYLATAWVCPFEGAINANVVLHAAAALHEMGAKRLVIADTIGAAHPMQVRSLMQQLTLLAPAERYACHFHDTRAMGLANVYAAVEADIRHFDASIAGLGGCPFAPGASGNVATEDVVFMCEQMGFDTGIDMAHLIEASEFAQQIAPSAKGGNAYGYIKQYLQRTAESEQAVAQTTED